MTSILYSSVLEDMARGTLNFGTNAFKVMLVGFEYAALDNSLMKETHARRSDVSAYEVQGVGYEAGGKPVAVTVAPKEPDSNKTDVNLGGVTWTPSTLKAYGAVYYKSRGGLDSVDELVAYIDFGGPVSATLASFDLTPSLVRFVN